MRGHQVPTAVVHVRSLARSRATGVTWVDGFGAVEHCSAEGGVVRMRQPARARLEDFAGLPRFVLADQQEPSLRTGQLLEEIVQEDQVLGWLYWEPASGPSKEADHE